MDPVTGCVSKYKLQVGNDTKVQYVETTTAKTTPIVDTLYLHFELMMNMLRRSPLNLWILMFLSRMTQDSSIPFLRVFRL